MLRTMVTLAFLLSSLTIRTAEDKQTSYPSFDYETARAHEIKPHRRTIPHEGVDEGDSQLHLTLTVSATGDVVDAKAEGETNALRIWPDLEGEVRGWKFTPFEKDGKAVTAEVEEYIGLVPPERLPKRHVAAPPIRSDSNIKITLARSGCFGSCPSYRATVATNGIVFEGGGNVVARGKHSDTVEAGKVRELAQRFVEADFYSMDAEYRASVTDCPTYVLSIDIDGKSKEVEDYVGSWVGMPAVISELEDEVDALAQTNRWIEGKDGLVKALLAEKFDFKTFEAQVMLKEIARRGETATLEDLLEAGVPLKPIPAPKRKEAYMGVLVEQMGWLTAARDHPDALQALIDAGASKSDQRDKDLALVGAARSGQVEAARALMDYGANPNADLGKEIVTEQGAGLTIGMQGAGSVLIYAAESGNPEMVREILRYHPKLEARDHEGKTAVFSAAEIFDSRSGEARAECLRLLVQAGADVNARDNDGDAALHKAYATEVVKELLNLGADVNARNKDGETPIFTTYDDAAIPLFVAHGADLSIRNKKGQTVMEAAKAKGSDRQKALQKAIATLNQR